MATYFDFTEAGLALVSATTPGQTLNFSEGGVDFTVSLGNPVQGFGLMAVMPSLQTSGANGGLLVMGTASDGPDVFKLAASDGSKNEFWGSATNPITIGGAYTYMQGVWNVQFVGANGAPNQTYILSQSRNVTGVVGRFSEIVFTVHTPAPPHLQNQLAIAYMNATVNCFLTGTMIATPSGDVAIETLKAGDQVLRADGGVTSVKWLGEQKISTRFQHPAKVNPIRISAGALGEGLPKRDLFVTADHALGLDGMLVNAGALVNGTTITQAQTMPRDGFSYWHVETEGHELILAEGCPVESYIDYVGRDGFDTVAGKASAGRISEMPLPRISAARHVPAELIAKINPALAA